MPRLLAVVNEAIDLPMISLKGERQLAVLIENLGHSPQGVLRLNGRELLFGEADRGNVNTNKRILSVRMVTA